MLSDTLLLVILAQHKMEGEPEVILHKGGQERPP